MVWEGNAGSTGKAGEAGLSLDLWGRFVSGLQPSDVFGGANLGLRPRLVWGRAFSACDGGRLIGTELVWEGNAGSTGRAGEAGLSLDLWDCFVSGLQPLDVFGGANLGLRPRLVWGRAFSACDSGGVIGMERVRKGSAGFFPCGGIRDKRNGKDKSKCKCGDSSLRSE